MAQNKFPQEVSVGAIRQLQPEGLHQDETGIQRGPGTALEHGKESGATDGTEFQPAGLGRAIRREPDLQIYTYDQLPGDTVLHPYLFR